MLLTIPVYVYVHVLYYNSGSIRIPAAVVRLRDARARITVTIMRAAAGLVLPLIVAIQQCMALRTQRIQDTFGVQRHYGTRDVLLVRTPTSSDKHRQHRPSAQVESRR